MRGDTAAYLNDFFDAHGLSGEVYPCDEEWVDESGRAHRGLHFDFRSWPIKVKESSDHGDHWFFGVPDGYPYALLLCREGATKEFIPLLLTSEFFESHGRSFGLRDGDRKINVRRRGGRLLIDVPGHEYVRVPTGSLAGTELQALAPRH